MPIINKTPFYIYFSLFALFFINDASAADLDVSQIKISIDTVWIVVSAALVFIMQAGFALLESGMVRSKNAINVVMKNYTDMCFGALAFWMFGYGLMFGSNPTGWIGLDHFFVNKSSGADHSLIFFHMLFAATAATIVSGALAERARFSAYVLASVIITAIIYTIFGSWAWGSGYNGIGWLKGMGFIDFAGSTVVHSVGGWCALAGILVLGPRLGRFSKDGQSRDIPGHNLPLVALGGFILWMGWFGFNGGSTLAAGADIGMIVLNTHLSASAGVVGAILFMMSTRAPVLMTNTVNGGLGGLVAITAGCATMDPMWAIVTGFMAGMLVVISSNLMARFALDDPVGAVAVHGFCGAWGTVAVGIFMPDRLFDIPQMIIQGIGVFVAFLWAFSTSYVMFKLIDKLMGLKASTISQQRGLDFAEHYEIGYPEFQSNLLHQGKEIRDAQR